MSSVTCAPPPNPSFSPVFKPDPGESFGHYGTQLTPMLMDGHSPTIHHALREQSRQEGRDKARPFAHSKKDAAKRSGGGQSPPASPRAPLAAILLFELPPIPR